MMEKLNCVGDNYRYTTYQDAHRVRLVDGLEFETNILRVSSVKLIHHLLVLIQIVLIRALSLAVARHAVRVDTWLGYV